MDTQRAHGAGSECAAIETMNREQLGAAAIGQVLCVLALEAHSFDCRTKRACVCLIH